MSSPTAADLDRYLELMPFARTLGVRLERAEPAEVVGALAWDPSRCTAGGVLHGGALMSLADTVGALVAYLNLPEGATTTTMTSTTQLFRPVTAGEVRAVARPLNVGRTVITAQTDLFDDRDRRVAQVTQLQAVRHG